jgi:hypothetical protein
MTAVRVTIADDTRASTVSGAPLRKPGGKTTSRGLLAPGKSRKEKMPAGPPQGGTKTTTLLRSSRDGKVKGDAITDLQTQTHRTKPAVTTAVPTNNTLKGSKASSGRKTSGSQEKR